MLPVWEPAPRGLPAGLQARPLGPTLASAGVGHPRRRAEGAHRTNRGSAQPVAPGCPASGAPAPFPPRRPGRTAPAYLRAAGGGRQLRSLFARGWLRSSDHGSSTHSHRGGPGSGGSQGPGSVSTDRPSVPPTPPPRREPGTELERPRAGFKVWAPGRPAPHACSRQPAPAAEKPLCVCLQLDCRGIPVLMFGFLTGHF